MPPMTKRLKADASGRMDGFWEAKDTSQEDLILSDYRESPRHGESRESNP